MQKEKEEDKEVAVETRKGQTKERKKETRKTVQGPGEGGSTWPCLCLLPYSPLVSTRFSTLTPGDRREEIVRSQQNKR
eukprot:2290171-Rhodomonas_salina.1